MLSATGRQRLCPGRRRLCQPIAAAPTHESERLRSADPCRRRRQRLRPSDIACARVEAHGLGLGHKPAQARETSTSPTHCGRGPTHPGAQGSRGPENEGKRVPAAPSSPPLAPTAPGNARGICKWLLLAPAERAPLGFSLSPPRLLGHFSFSGEGGPFPSNVGPLTRVSGLWLHVGSFDVRFSSTKLISVIDASVSSLTLISDV